MNIYRILRVMLVRFSPTEVKVKKLKVQRHLNVVMDLTLCYEENLEDFIFESNEDIAEGFSCPPRKLVCNDMEREDPAYELNNDNGKEFLKLVLP